MQTIKTNSNTPNIIDLSTALDINNIPDYPILITGAYLGDMLPDETGHFKGTTKTCSYGFNYNDDEGCEEYLLHNREEVYKLIKDITTAISKALTYRYTHKTQSGELLGSPHDDETCDISNAIDFLSVLDSIGSED